MNPGATIHELFVLQLLSYVFPLTSEVIYTRSVENVDAGRIITRIDGISLTSCHLRCKLNPDCVSVATNKNRFLGEEGTCILLRDQTLTGGSKAESWLMSHTHAQGM